MIVRETTTLLDVVDNFDLSCCKMIIGATLSNVFMGAKPENLEMINRDEAMLGEAYTRIVILTNNKFTRDRIAKYQSRGYTIKFIVPRDMCLENSTFPDERTKTIQDENSDVWLPYYILNRFGNVRPKRTKEYINAFCFTDLTTPNGYYDITYTLAFLKKLGVDLNKILEMLTTDEYIPFYKDPYKETIQTFIEENLESESGVNDDLTKSEMTDDIVSELSRMVLGKRSRDSEDDDDMSKSLQQSKKKKS